MHDQQHAQFEYTAQHCKNNKKKQKNEKKRKPLVGGRRVADEFGFEFVTDSITYSSGA